MDKPDRRLAILLAAEKLFSLHGYRSVTIRQIAREANVPPALVGYYFGQKQGLFHAIFDHWRHTIEERVALLAQVLATPDGDAVQRIARAFVEPVLRMRASAEGEYYALLVARELVYRAPESDRVLSEFFDPMAAAFIEALQQACPGSSRADATWAYQFSLGSLVHHISDHRVERLSGGAARPGAPDAAGNLIAFITAGITAVLGREKKVLGSAARERGGDSSFSSPSNHPRLGRRQPA